MAPDDSHRVSLLLNHYPKAVAVASDDDDAPDNKSVFLGVVAAAAAAVAYYQQMPTMPPPTPTAQQTKPAQMRVAEKAPAQQGLFDRYGRGL